MERLKMFLVDFLIAILIFTLVCIAMLVDIKTFETPKQSTAMKQVSSSLQKDKKDIELLSEELMKQEKNLQDIKNNMDSLKKDKDTEQWNSIVVDYNKKYGEYEKNFAEYNKKIEEYNKRYNQYKLLGNKDESVSEWLKSVIGID